MGVVAPVRLAAMSLGLIALTLVLGAIARWFWLAWRVAIPASPGLFMAVWATGLVIGVAGLLTPGGHSAAAWAVGLALLMLYLSVTAGQKVAANGIQVGDTIPAFTALDEHGALFDSASLAGSRFLLKFFRGHW